MVKTRAGFETALVLITLFMFLAIALNSFTNINLSPWTNAVLLVLAGAGLCIEGNILTIRNWAKNGIQRPEIPMVFTIIFGLLTIIVGVLAIPGVNLFTEQLKGIIGIVAIISMAFISIQKWIIN